MRTTFCRILFLVTILLTGHLSAQTLEGTVSYTGTAQVYVKFAQTANIHPGDTLYVGQGSEKPLAALVVINKSSISCVCSRISLVQLQKGDKVYHTAPAKIVDEVKAETPLLLPDVPEAMTEDTSQKVPKEQNNRETRLRGRFSVASYTTAYSPEPTVSQRMRYTLSLTATHLARTPLSAEAYVTFSHRDHQWSEIKKDIFQGLKIYSLSVNYQINPQHKLSLGRKINPNISQLGVNDGLQYEFSRRSFSLGILAGSRPDQQNFTLNTGLLQAGAYLSHTSKRAAGLIQSSVALVEQTNKGLTDRRFIYLQHANSLLPKLYAFGSLEFDLFQKVQEVSKQQFSLSNAYLSLRYRPLKQLSLSLSYSQRQAIIYYETYKNIVEQLLEQQATQGVNFQADYRPGKIWNLGFRAGYRSNASDSRDSRNLHAYLHLTRLPLLELAASLSATFTQSPYLNGDIYSLSLYKDFVQGRLNSSVSYRYLQYRYLSGEFTQKQHLTELGLAFRLTRKLFLSLNTEHTFEKTVTAHRIYLGITQRF